MTNKAVGTIFPSIAISGIAFLMGLLINAFIVGVNFVDWWRGRQIKAADKILISLSVSRMAFQCISLLEAYSKTFLQLSLNTIIVIDIFSFFSFYTSLWLVTLLSVFYFLTVANHKHLLFLCLKMMMLKRMPNFIAAAMLLAFSNTGLHPWLATGEFTEGNVTLDTQIDKACNYKNRSTHTIVFLLGNCGPFLIYDAAFILLFNSLWHHMKRMRNMGNGFTTNHLNRYYVAIKSLAICFLIYVLHISCNLFYIFCSYVINQIWMHLVVNAFPSLHSAYLIYLTPKLRQRFSMMLPHRTKGGPNSDGRLEAID